MADDKKKSASDKLREEFLNPAPTDVLVDPPIDEEEETEEEKAAKAKIIKDEKSKANPDKTKTEEEEIKDPELSEQQVLAYLKKQGVSAIDSLADIKDKLQAPLSTEEKEQQARQQRGEKIKFAIANGLGTVEEIAAWEKEVEENEDEIAYHDFYRKLKKQDKNLSDEQIKKLFDKSNYQDLDDDVISKIEDEEDRTEAKMLKELGKSRITGRGQRRKEEVKNRLQTIDNRFNDHITWQKKAGAFRDVVKDLVENDIDGTYTFDYEVGKEKIPITAKLGEVADVKKAVSNYFLETQAGVQIIGAGKYDKQTLKSYLDSYFWADPKFRNRIANAIGDYRESIGVGKGKMGTTGEIKHPDRTVADDEPIDPMVKELQERLKSK